MEKVEKKVRVSKDIPVDGKKAYLPHPVFQSTLFAATRTRKEGEYRKNSLTVVSENQFGDIVTIVSPRTLFVSPDMGVFLATVACAQHAGFTIFVNSETGEQEPFMRAEFPLSWLYELTGISGKGKGRYQLLTSLEVLGHVGLSIRFSDKSALTRQRGKYSFIVDNFWRLSIERRMGRKGSIVKLYPSPFLAPKERFLWADAELCNKLKKDTAKGIFWQLICREHQTGTAEEWRKWLNASEDWEVKKWKHAQLIPALEELAGYGYTVKEDGDEITVARPKTEFHVSKRIGKNKYVKVEKLKRR